MTATEHGFKAEVQQLLQLMIRSVYSDREVFLRELLSNASDALDKVRFLEVTRSDLTDGEGETGIHITVDTEAKTITIADDGIGMTEEEVIENLGTIAHSGSKTFMQQLEEGTDVPDLIGQFGVGFYSAFMIADEVTVHTRSALPEAAGVVWRSRGEGTYEIEAGDRTSRGTTITLHLRDDATDEFLDAGALQRIVRKHSNYLPWTITVDGESANAGKALWREKPSDVTDEEANAFYKTVAMDWQDPALRLHVSVDTPLQYHALLFVPSERPHDLFMPEVARGPRLYAKRVLIEENAKDLLPDWLRFVKGVVDSEDISLNVSREMVQKTPVVQKIRSALTKRVLKELGRLAKAADAPVEDEEEVESDVIDAEEVDAPAITDADRWKGIWKNFGVCLKEGYYHNSSQYGDRVVELLRFNALSHADADGIMSLAQYKANMAEGQDTIWFLAAESREACLLSPHLEAFKKKGIDVLLMTETVDEWLLNVLTEYDGVSLKSVARGELDLEDEEDTSEKADVTGLAPWMQDVLGERVKSVRASTRLTDSPCVLVDDEDGMSANLERILRSANQPVYSSKRILEVNSKHPLIKNLAKLHEQGQETVAQPLVELLYDDALLMEGTIQDTTAMGKRLQSLLERAAEQALQ